MNISIFDVMGPVMIGPSSSHTAGAAKLARAAAAIAQKPFDRVEFGLAGSFAKTGKGHGTDRALLAGALGYREDDEDIRHIFDIAARRGIGYTFAEIELPESHENTARITFFHTDGTRTSITGSSIGGGRILITAIGDTQAEISAESPTIVITQHDQKGVVSGITRLLAENDINIGVMRLTRVAKGDVATTVIETDSDVPPTLAGALTALPHVLSVRILNL